MVQLIFAFIHIRAVQHSCGNENANCEMILQYMCGEDVRDGTKVKTIPLKDKDCSNNNCQNDIKFGHHESKHYYDECAHRERNLGLFTSNQVNKFFIIFTHKLQLSKVDQIKISSFTAHYFYSLLYT